MRACAFLCASSRFGKKMQKKCCPGVHSSERRTAAGLPCVPSSERCTAEGIRRIYVHSHAEPSEIKQSVAELPNSCFDRNSYCRAGWRLPSGRPVPGSRLLPFIRLCYFYLRSPLRKQRRCCIESISRCCDYDLVYAYVYLICICIYIVFHMTFASGRSISTLQTARGPH